MQIAHLGTFDVENYGDLLFPLLAAKRLASHYADSRLVHVSPAGGAPVWHDSVPTIGYERFAAAQPELGGVLVGGGNIIRSSRSNLDAYAGGLVPLFGYADLWLGVAYEPWISAPICWNSPGVPEPIAPVLRPIVRAALERTSYISVRDEASRDFLLDVGPDARIAVVPDPAWDIPSLWSKSELADAYEAAFELRGMVPPERSIAFHINSRYLAGLGIEGAAALLDDCCAKLDGQGVLLALGRCHADDVLARQVGAAMRSSPLVVDRPGSLVEMAALLAGSVGYVGSSMHGFITASAFGRPAAMVASRKVVKFPGLICHLDDPDVLFGKWAEALVSLQKQVASDNIAKRNQQLAILQSRLDDHWSSIELAFDGRGRSAIASQGVNRSAYREAVLTAHVLGSKNLGSAEEKRINEELSAARKTIARLENALCEQSSSIALLSKEAERARQLHEEMSAAEVRNSELEKLAEQQAGAIALLTGELRERDNEITALRSREDELRRELKRGNLERKDLIGRIENLRAELKHTANRKRLRERQLLEHSDYVRVLKARLRAAERARSKILDSRSWMVTKPLRAASSLLRWFGRHSMRLAAIGGCILTGRFAEAANELLRYYRRLVPPAVRSVVPAHLTTAVRGLIEEPRPIPERIIELAARPSNNQSERPATSPDLHSSTYNSRRPYTYLSMEQYRARIERYRAEKAARGGANRIAVYSAIVGDYDSQKVHEFLDPAIDYHLFVDRPTRDLGLFEIRAADFFSVDTTRIARFVKTHPHVLLGDYDIAIWVDGNIIIRDDISSLVAAFEASGEAVGAIPHPLRRSVYEEAAECIKRGKDESDLISAQTGAYDDQGFDCDNLVESNLLMFNLRHPQLGRFLDTWWRELERGSRRDQLSFNYALKNAGLDYFPLTERPNSVRNHPKLALLAHGSGQESSPDLASLGGNVVDPCAGPSYSEVRNERIGRYRETPIDIVVCVHNALDDVVRCLASVDRARCGSAQRIIIVDDGSEADTREYLKEFAASRKDVLLHRNDIAVGYTRSANIGLRLSTGEMVVLLNSDTIVTDGWAEKLADALFTTPGAGLVGPMSNAASHQSLPEHRSGPEQTAINDLPEGVTPEDMNALCERWTTTGSLPRTPLVHGFCFGFSRALLEKVGYLDEENFPRGYGEENDYCFRAADAGFGLVIATHTYVWHAKSKSFGSAKRLELVTEGNRRVHELHGRKRVVRAIQSMQENPALQRMRTQAAAFYGTKARKHVAA